MFNIYRCNFNQVDQTPVLIGTQMFSVKVGGSNFALSKIAGLTYFTVTGNRNLILEGDILIPVSANSQFPPMTIMNFDNGLPIIAFKTARICNIVYSLNTGDTVYTNIYYDFISITTSQQGLIKDLSGALRIATKEIAMWTRPNVSPGSQAAGADIQGMRIVENDPSTILPIRYIIQAQTSVGNVKVFSIDQEVT
jgi:hypothetical protein